jgi:hypothetical protein
MSESGSVSVSAKALKLMQLRIYSNYRFVDSSCFGAMSTEGQQRPPVLSASTDESWRSG